MPILALIIALMLAPLAAATSVEHDTSVEAAHSHCCDEAPHLGSECVVACALVPAPAGPSAASHQRDRHPLPADVAFTAVILSGALDPPRFG